MGKSLIAVTLLALAAAGCASRRGPVPVGDPSLPRVGWVIMYGDQDNPDAEFACQSNPRNACAIHASGPGTQTLSDVHLYFHPAKTDARYTGTVRIGFFSNAATSPGVKPALTVKPGDVGNHSVVGIVTDRPGRYTLNIDITADTASGGTQHIRDEVPVVVETIAAQ